MNREQSYKAEVIGGTHGVSCVFPTLKNIIEYEEKIRVPSQGYPRFTAHPFVKLLQDSHATKRRKMIATQTPEAADFVHLNYFDEDTRKHSDVLSFGEGKNRYGLISVDREFAQSALEGITNTGIVLSSRKAQRILNNSLPGERSENLPDLLSSLEKRASSGLTFLYSSGMAAIFDAVSGFLKKRTRAVVIGNTYVDTRKIFRNLPERFDYKPTLFLKSGSEISIPPSTSIVFLEVPTNPLLRTENLEEIVQKAHKKGAIVIVDSTIASPYHFSPFEHGADLIIHSTSKSLSGKNNHMGGVLFVNPDFPDHANKILHSPFELDDDDGIILADNLQSFPKRIKRMSENAGKVADYLRQNPKINTVYYPTGLKNGIGHIISFELKEDCYKSAEEFYDHCKIPSKGPSMGFEKTMLMPYSLMAHYHDTSEDLKDMGLKKYLMRLSVGTEKPDEIIGYLAAGIDAVHP